MMAQTNSSNSPPPQQPSTTIPPTDLARLQTYLNLPSTGHLSDPYTTPLAFLAAYIDLIPSSLTYLFHESTTPQERSRIKQVKARRMIWAGLGGGKSSAEQGRGRERPDELSAEEGWKRFPLLWERLGGDPFGPPRNLYTTDRQSDDNDEDEERIPRDRQRDDLISILSANRPSSSDTQTIPRPKPKPKSMQGGTGLFGAMDDDEDDVASMSSIPLQSSTKTSTSTKSDKTPSTAASAPAAQAQQPTSKSAHLESQWPTQSFMPTSTDRSSVLKVNKLGSLMRDMEEEREALEVVAARRRERRDMAAAERRGRERLGGNAMGDLMGGEEEEAEDIAELEVGKSQEEVVEAFERHLLELFLDGMDVRTPLAHSSPT